MNFRLLGFPVTVDSSVFLIGLMWLAYGLRDGEPAPLAAGGVIAVFASILWHELGHAFAARAFGLAPIDITLHGFGGLTRHRPSGRAWKDLVVTLSGPGNGFLLGVLAIVALRFAPPGVLRSLTTELAFVNVFWSAFNLLPMFPMDGGQALFAGLRIVAPRRARVVTGSVGMLMAAAILAFAVYLVVTGSSSALFLGYLAVTSGQRCWAMLQPDR